MVDEGKSVSASYSHYCPVFVSDNGHALSYRFGWKWTLSIALFHLPPKRGAKERSAPFGSGSTAGSPPLHQTLSNDAGLGGESSSAEVASFEAGTFILFVLVCI